MAEQRTEEGKRAKIEYIRQYNKQNYDNVALRFPKGDRERYKTAAADRGFSLAAFAAAAMNEYIEHHPTKK